MSSVDLSDVAIASGQDTEMVNTINRLYELQLRHFVLEAGCGTGKLGMSMACQFGCHVTLVDNGKAPLQMATRLKWGVQGLRGTDIPVCIGGADITKLPYDDDTFHLVFNEGVIEHFRDPSVPLKEMIRVSRDAVCVMVPNALNTKQVEMAQRQVEAYKDRPDQWPAYEAPMTEKEVKEILEKVGLSDVFTTLLWADPKPPKSRADFRMVLGFGRKGKRE